MPVNLVKHSLWASNRISRTSVAQSHLKTIILRVARLKTSRLRMGLKSWGLVIRRERWLYSTRVRTKTQTDWVIKTYRLLGLGVAVASNSKTISSSKTKFVKVWMAFTERARKRWSYLKADMPLKVVKTVKREGQNWGLISYSKWARAWKRRPAWKSLPKVISIKANRQKAIMQRRVQAMTIATIFSSSNNSKTQASFAGLQATSTRNKVKVMHTFKRSIWSRKKQMRKVKRSWMELVAQRVLIGLKLSMNMLLVSAPILSLGNQRLKQLNM